MSTLLAQASTPTDPDLIKSLIVSIAIVVGLGLVGFFLVSYISFRKDNRIASEYLTRVFVGGSALHLLTVLAVILSATVLSLAGKLEQGIVALLSGIAGYVLGGLRETSRPAKTEVSSSTIGDAEE
jgi:hypothetical protein